MAREPVDFERMMKEFYEPQNGREMPPDPMALEDAYFDAVRSKLNSVRSKLPLAVRRKRGWDRSLDLTAWNI